MRMLAIVALLSMPLPARADDAWENGLFHDDDAPAFTTNQLLHGARQTHDLQGPAASPDRDCFIYLGWNHHSYEARVSSGTLLWNTARPMPELATFERVGYEGDVLQSAFSTGVAASLKWIVEEGDFHGFVRARGSGLLDYTANERYDIELLDTTYFLPRWNNVGGQVTVLLIQNTLGVPVSGKVFFHDAGGALLHAEAFTLPPSGLHVVNSASATPLAGRSGSATIAHTGGYGALAGKAVSLEPSSGIALDTALAPVPR
jgi:hypothetical protein